MDTVQDFFWDVFYTAWLHKKEMRDKLIEMHIGRLLCIFFQIFNLVPRVSSLVTRSRNLEMRSQAFFIAAGVVYT